MNSVPGADGPVEAYAYDPEAAKKLLAESTYGGPEKLPKIMFVGISLPANEAAAQYISEQWRQNLGITAVDMKPQQDQYAGPDQNAVQIFRPSWHLVTKHILRPVLTPVVTQLGLIMITIINGAIFVELIFGLPGLGRLTVKSLMDSDFPVILAITLIGSFLVMISNLLVDLVYPLLDPRATGTRTGK